MIQLIALALMVVGYLTASLFGYHFLVKDKKIINRSDRLVTIFASFLLAPLIPALMILARILYRIDIWIFIWKEKRSRPSKPIATFSRKNLN
jgi:hypothetical protein